MTTQEIDDLLDGFSFNLTDPRALKYVFLNSIMHSIDVKTLTEFTLDKLSSITGKEYGELLAEYLKYRDENTKEIMADLASKLGELDEPTTLEG